VAKNVFKPQDIMYISRKVFIEPPKIVAEEPVEDVEEAQQRIVAIIRKLEEQGEIVVARAGEEELVV
jgi:ABC-type ATPase involved in cell division